MRVLSDEKLQIILNVHASGSAYALCREVEKSAIENYQSQQVAKSSKPFEKLLDEMFAFVPESCRETMAVSLSEIKKFVSDAGQLHEELISVAATNENLHDQLANIEFDMQALKEQKPAYKIGYQYDEGIEDPELGGDLVLHHLDGKEYPLGTLFYASQVVPAQQEAKLVAEIARLNQIINHPQKDNFILAVSTEAEHQRQRWGSSHDDGKAPSDWFWLIGYLAGKALHSCASGDTEKTEHHIITTAAACANWHLALLGRTDMRPGILNPLSWTNYADENKAIVGS